MQTIETTVGTTASPFCTTANGLNWSLMENNIPREDLDLLIRYLQQDEPRLTHGAEVLAFEREWSEWLGVQHSVMVNSGASANLLSMTAIKELYGAGEVIVPSLTWSSDIASVLQNGLTPVFVDIDSQTLGMDIEQVISRLNDRTRAVFLTHILGYNALNQRLLDALSERGIPLIEDVCESHGATYNGRKLGTFGLMSNFSFYFAHHMSTIEGGIISTDDPDLYEMLRMLRSHGMVRESKNNLLKADYREKYPDLNPDFIFAFPAYNVRPTELNAVLGRAQLKRLDANNRRRQENLDLFLNALDPDKYYVEFATEGSCNYAFTLILRNPDPVLNEQVTDLMRREGVEFRRGTSGGGNQLRQPFVRRVMGEDAYRQFPRVDHVHFYGYYLGNYPTLDRSKITRLCTMLNALPGAARRAA
jgi:CDP-6-deoxy-D-xylo-4-hexulose-3-dehydrase